MKIKYFKKIKAFTLIELLVVVAIIGILSAVGVVAYNGFTENAKLNTLKTNHQNIVKIMRNTIMICQTGVISTKIGKQTILCINNNAQQFKEDFIRYLDEEQWKNPYTGLEVYNGTGGRWNGISTSCCYKGKNYINVHTWWTVGASKPDLETYIYWGE